MLEEARLSVIWIFAIYYAKEVYDGAICLCEGAFCLFGEGEDSKDWDLSILKNMVNISIFSWTHESGEEESIPVKESWYIPTED